MANDWKSNELMQFQQHYGKYTISRPRIPQIKSAVQETTKIESAVQSHPPDLASFGRLNNYVRLFSAHQKVGMADRFRRRGVWTAKEIPL
eukprot:6189077-Pleurochrysis_carterae.AAC.1